MKTEKEIIASIIADTFTLVGTGNRHRWAMIAGEIKAKIEIIRGEFTGDIGSAKNVFDAIGVPYTEDGSDVILSTETLAFYELQHLNNC